MENPNKNYTEKGRGAGWLLGGIVAVIVVLTIAYVRSDYDRTDLSTISPAAGEENYISSSTPAYGIDTTVSTDTLEARGLTDMPPQPEPQP